MPPEFTREVALDAEALATAQDELAAFLESHGVPALARQRVRLVIEELGANLMMHAGFPRGPGPLLIRAEPTAAAVLLAIEDAAEPFDPRATPEPPPPDLEHDYTGGMGLALVRRVAEIRGYHRLPDGRNRTELAVPLA